MLFTSLGEVECIGGVIMHNETIREKSASGTPLAEALTVPGILPGIKDDTGAKPLAGSLPPVFEIASRSTAAWVPVSRSGGR